VQLVCKHCGFDIFRKKPGLSWSHILDTKPLGGMTYCQNMESNRKGKVSGEWVGIGTKAEPAAEPAENPTINAPINAPVDPYPWVNRKDFPITLGDLTEGQYAVVANETVVLCVSDLSFMPPFYNNEIFLNCANVVNIANGVGGYSADYPCRRVEMKEAFTLALNGVPDGVPVSATMPCTDSHDSDAKEYEVIWAGGNVTHLVKAKSDQEALSIASHMESDPTHWEDSDFKRCRTLSQDGKKQGWQRQYTGNRWYWWIRDVPGPASGLVN
jgi:hypothetical protein